MLCDVLIAKTESTYPIFPYDDYNHPMYRSLRRMFEAWGKDPDNPFGSFVGPGDTIVIKPNWVTHQNMGGHGLESLLTHSSLIKYIVFFAAVALRGRGSIIVGDAPLQGCNFQKLVTYTGIDRVIEAARKGYPAIDFRIEDWRLTVMRDEVLSVRPSQSQRNNYQQIVDRDYILVNLGKNSFLEDIADYSRDFRVYAYKKDLMRRHHYVGKHEYLVTKRIKQADLFINLPKMKTHMKEGLTGALKNVIGINGHKEYLPHHIKGAYQSGGDAYMRIHPMRNMHEWLSDWLADNYAEMAGFSSKMFSYFLDLLRWSSVLCAGESTSLGSWSGNETIWRTTLDLNHILYFSEASPQKTITIIDGIIAGEGQGPLKPRPKPVGILLAGENPAYIDAVIAKLMGYNVSRIPTVFNAIYDRRSKFAGPFLSEFNIISMLDRDELQQVAFDDIPDMCFKKPKFWGHAAAPKNAKCCDINK